MATGAVKHSQTNTNPQVAVIIVCWNNLDLLQECFESIYNQSYKNWRIIVIDNGSTDGSVAYINKNFPDITLIEPKKNLGFAVANNLGFDEAFKEPSCEYVLLLNTDARIREDWIEKMVSFGKKHPKAAALQSLTVDYYNHEIVDSCGILVDQAGLATQMGYRLKHIELKTQRVFGVNAAAALYSRAFLTSQPFGNDYFDSDLFMYLEDVDLAARSVMLGWESYFVNESVAYHMGSASSGKNPGFSLFMTYRNNAPMLLKNFPGPIIRRVLPGLVRAELARIRGFSREGKWRLIWQILKGRLVSLKMLPLYARKRAVLKKHWAIDEESLWSLMRPPRFRRLTPKELGADNEPVTIIVLSHDNVNTISGCIDSLLTQTYKNYEILIVDNASSDGSIKLLKEKYPDLSILENPENYGPINAYNEGIVRAARDLPDYIALAKADSHYPKAWLSSLIDTMHDDNKIFAVGSSVKRGNGVYSGYHYLPSLGAVRIAGREAAIFASETNGALLKYDLFDRIGLFDGDFFRGLEGVDLCFRARLMGYTCLNQTKTIVEELGGAMYPDAVEYYHFAKNSYFIYLKNVPFKIFISNLPSAFALAIKSIMHAIKLGGVLLGVKLIAKCIIKTPRMLRRRSVNQQIRLLRSSELRQHFSNMASQL